MASHNKKGTPSELPPLRQRVEAAQLYQDFRQRISTHTGHEPEEHFSGPVVNLYENFRRDLERLAGASIEQFFYSLGNSESIVCHGLRSPAGTLAERLSCELVLRAKHRYTDEQIEELWASPLPDDS